MTDDAAKRKQAIDKVVAALLGTPPSYDDLRAHNARLLAFIERLAGANERERRHALKPFKPKQAVKKGGRPKVRSIEEDVDLADVVDELQKYYGCTTRTQTIRRVIGDDYLKKGHRRNRVDTPEAKAEIKTLLNRITAAKPKKIISRKLKRDISGKK